MKQQREIDAATFVNDFSSRFFNREIFGTLSKADADILKRLPVSESNKLVKGSMKASDDAFEGALTKGKNVQQADAAALKAFQATFKTGLRSKGLSAGAADEAAAAAATTWGSKIKAGLASPITQMGVMGGIMLVPFLYGLMSKKDGTESGYPPGVDPNDPLGVGDMFGPEVAKYAPYLASTLIWGCCCCCCLLMLSLLASMAGGGGGGSTGRGVNID